MLLLCAVLALASCRNRRHTVETTTTQTTERETTRVSRDTTLLTSADSVKATVAMPCDTVTLLDTVYVKSNQASLRMWSAPNPKTGAHELHGVAMCDTVALKARLWDTFTREHKDTTTTVKETIIKTKTPTWAWWLLVAAVLLALKAAWPLLRKLFVPI